MSLSKLSLVASFDELRRNTAVLTEGCEADFTTFVKNQENCRQKWLEAEKFIADMQRKINGLEVEKVAIEKLESEKNALELKLKHARNQLNTEMDRRNKAEQEKDCLERKLAIIQELLIDKKSGQSLLNEEDKEKLAFLSMSYNSYHGDTPKRMDTIMESSASILSPSDISYDKTEDDLETSYLRSGRRWKRPSAPPAEELTPPKRTRSDEDNSDGQRTRKSLTATTTMTFPKDGAITASSEIITVPTTKSENRRRSSRRPRRSVGQVRQEDDSDDNYWGVGGYAKNNNAAATVPKGILKERQHTTPTIERSPSLRSYGSASRLNRAHVFVSKTVMKPETCVPCGKRIKFGKPGMKCKDCRATCHPDCKDFVPLPCVPTTVSTPGNKVQAVISDYVPSSPPYIPGILIHCVQEVENRGLCEVGIYRVPGSDKQVKELKDKMLRNKSKTNLADIDDINVVCGCIKDFLRNLKEPLVTFELWGDFVKAAEKQDEAESTRMMFGVINSLPQANRETLAFMILHLQRIAETPECKMPASNLAKVFGPTIVGHSTAQPEPVQMITETKKQAMVMEKLMSLSDMYWTSFLHVDENMLPVSFNLQTPEARSGLQSMLGPITPHSRPHTESTGSLSQKAKALFSGKTPSTPRFSTISKGKGSKRPTHFFSSPMLK